MEEFTPPPTIFDTYVPGLLSSQTAAVVGALRTVAFEVVPEPDDTYSLVLRYYWPREAQEPSAKRQAEALRKYVVPCLADPKDCVVEVAESQGLVFKRYVLLLMVHDPQRELRGVGALLVDCPHAKEAERRLLRLKEMAVG